MTKAELNNELIAIKAGEIMVFNYDSETREYLSSSVESLAVGVGIPACSCIDSPGKSKEGHAVCRNNTLDAWTFVADHRGDTVYSTISGEAITLLCLGEYPPDTTLMAPATPFDKWDGSEWITDEAAKCEADIAVAEQQREMLITQVDNITADYRVMLMLGDISDTDKGKLVAWMDYKKALKVVDTSTAPNIIWPAHPDE